MATTGPRKPWEHDAYCPGIGRDRDHPAHCANQPGYPVLDDSNRAGYLRAMRLADAYYKGRLGAMREHPIDLGRAMAELNARLTARRASEAGAASAEQDRPEPRGRWSRWRG